MKPRPRPIARVLFAVIAPVRQFFRTQAAGGVVLIAAAALALLVAASPYAEAYQRFVHMPLSVSLGGRAASIDLHGLVNDVLMTVFFVVAGMEIKRELVTGELRTLRRATLPLAAALGGMIAPALLFLAQNRAGPARAGWAIPTATDIAFALGCLSLVRRRVPWSLVVFLTALAIFDDLGAIVIIALFYGKSPHWPSLAIAVAPALGLVALTRSGVHRLSPYLALGAVLWVAIARSGIHPTVAGVLLGLAIPTSSRRPLADTLEQLDVGIETLRQLPERRAEGSLVALEEHARAAQPLVERSLRLLHGPVAFGIVPLFAFVNAGVEVPALSALGSPVTVGVAAGLVVGKTVGVFGATAICIRTGISPMPSGASWRHVLGVAAMAGIGFTMSIFVTGLAFRSAPELEVAAKIGILGGSLVSALFGLGLLRSGPPVAAEAEEVPIVDVDLPRFADDFRVAPWQPRGEHAGRTIGELALRQRHGVTVLGVWREVPGDASAGEGPRYRKLAAIDADFRVSEGDTMLLVGDAERVTRFLAEHGGDAPVLAARGLLSIAPPPPDDD